MFDKSVKHEFWTIRMLGALLKGGLCLTGTGPLGIPCRRRGSSGDMVAAYHPDAPGALYQESVSIVL